MRGRDLGWGLLALFMALNAVLGVVFLVVRLAEGDAGYAVRAALGLPFAYWIGMGAWRRTTWGAPRPDT